MKPNRRLAKRLDAFETQIREARDTLEDLHYNVRKLSNMLAPIYFGKRRRKKNDHQLWSKADDKFIRDHAGAWSRANIAKVLCRSAGSVSTRAYWLGISLRKTRKHLKAVA
jgi:hypothetical protein